jgi:hypothetical protein
VSSVEVAPLSRNADITNLLTPAFSLCQGWQHDRDWNDYPIRLATESPRTGRKYLGRSFETVPFLSTLDALADCVTASRSFTVGVAFGDCEAGVPIFVRDGGDSNFRLAGAQARLDKKII